MTATVLTGGGGWHLLFRYPSCTTVRSGPDKLGPGVDVKGCAGYIVAPPSIHRTGNPYRWHNSPHLIADAPDDLLEILTDDGNGYHTTQTGSGKASFTLPD